MHTTILCGTTFRLSGVHRRWANVLEQFDRGPAIVVLASLPVAVAGYDADESALPYIR